MRLKHHILLYTFLSVAVLLSIYLALDYGIQAQRSAQALEDAYAQRVLETQEHLQAIGLKLGKAPVAADARTQVELLAGISRQADSVVSGLSALPLSHIAMSDTLKFCNQLSEYAMVLALSVAAGQPLTEQETAELVSLEKQVTPNMPPTFLWHTFEDEAVFVENTLMLAAAMRRENVKFELHIFPDGPHGFSLANAEVAGDNQAMISPVAAQWFGLAADWIRRLQ